MAALVARLLLHIGDGPGDDTFDGIRIPKPVDIGFRQADVPEEDAAAKKIRIPYLDGGPQPGIEFSEHLFRAVGKMEREAASLKFTKTPKKGALIKRFR